MRKWVIGIVAFVSLAAVAFMVVFTLAYEEPAYVHEVPPEATKQVNPPTVDELLALVNAERAKVNVMPLVIDNELNLSAQFKTNDMVARNYYTHEDPVTGRKNGLDYLNSLGNNCTSVSENYTGADDSQDAINLWLNSPSHKAAILDSKYDSTGFGVTKATDWYIVVEHFCDLP